MRSKYKIVFIVIRGKSWEIPEEEVKKFDSYERAAQWIEEEGTSDVYWIRKAFERDYSRW